MENTHLLTSRKLLFVLSGSIVVSICCVLVSLKIGAVDINFTNFFTSLFSAEANSEREIIYNLRLPRALLAFTVGAGLSVVGTSYQAILKNPLAEPYILGISGGGALGAIISFLLGLPFIFTQFIAFLGALLVMFFVYFVSRRYGELDPKVLLLSGVMISSFCGSLILIIMTMLNENLRDALFWVIGNLSLADTNSLIFVMPVTIIAALVISFYGQKLNVLSLGDEQAKVLGINTQQVKNIIYILSSLVVGSVVAVSGLIGFVGLIIPHMSRRLFGMDNRIIVPVSFFMGGSYLIIADTISRTLIPPIEIPVGAVTALIGAPIFIFIMKRK